MPIDDARHGLLRGRCPLRDPFRADAADDHPRDGHRGAHAADAAPVQGRELAIVERLLTSGQVIERVIRDASPTASGPPPATRRFCPA
ncbi:hypothetical protein [Microbacterium sp. B35-04]|uniref:hypothetical protein n=1 Tax=Microbacterium sp. B35-04 TaxID=1961716 RepID=UPI0013D47FC5|nr:hypothetical protein [Microbacterium sp. B35-04]